MKKLSRIWMLVLVVSVVGCGRTAEPSSSAETAAPSLTLTMPADFEILPTSTPKPPPPTPTYTPVPTPMPTPTPSTAEAATMTPVELPATPTSPTEEATMTPVELPATPTQASPAEVEAPMMAIPAGEFTMGSDVEDERPAHVVFVGAFEIDMFEVTNEGFARFVEETDYVTDAEKEGDSMPWRVYSEGKPKHPVVKVSWNDAKAYCEWVGKRLPTEAEWEKAARGTDARIYPWGNEWDVAKANTKEAGYRGTIIVGSLPDGASPYGVMDMAGNVAEWTADWFKAYPGSDYQSPYFGEKYRVIRGGGWFSDEELVRTTERSASSVTLANDDVGFRCAR